MYCKNRHAIAINPFTKKDPSMGGHLRILLAGRKDIYEYDDERAEGEKWIINDAGLDKSLHYNFVELVPWMGSVQFDPTISGKVFALQTSDRSSMSDWKDTQVNANCIYEGQGTVKPVYMSTDWGKTWVNLDHKELPEMLTASTLHVSKQGELYVASINSGYYQTDPKNFPLNIEKTVKTNYKIYPNPAQHSITIELEKNMDINKPITIYTALGNIYKQLWLNNNKEQIDVTDWPKGVSFIKPFHLLNYKGAASPDLPQTVNQYSRYPGLDLEKL